MIVREIIEVNGNRLVRTYSDAGLPIRKIGTDEIYGEAVDPENSGREYEETSIDDEWMEMNAADDEATTEDYEAALAELGVIE